MESGKNFPGRGNIVCKRLMAGESKVQSRNRKKSVWAEYAVRMSTEQSEVRGWTGMKLLRTSQAIEGFGL